jgi:hypothetical protein
LPVNLGAPRPVLDRGGKQPVEFGRRALERAPADVGETGGHHRVGEGRVDLGVERRDFRRRAASMPVAALAPNPAPSRCGTSFGARPLFHSGQSRERLAHAPGTLAARRHCRYKGTVDVTVPPRCHDRDCRNH